MDRWITCPCTSCWVDQDSPGLCCHWWVKLPSKSPADAPVVGWGRDTLGLHCWPQFKSLTRTPLWHILGFFPSTLATERIFWVFFCLFGFFVFLSMSMVDLDFRHVQHPVHDIQEMLLPEYLTVFRREEQGKLSLCHLVLVQCRSHFLAARVSALQYALQ